MTEYRLRRPVLGTFYAVCWVVLVVLNAADGSPWWAMVLTVIAAALTWFGAGYDWYVYYKYEGPGTKV